MLSAVLKRSAPMKAATRAGAARGFSHMKWNDTERAELKDNILPVSQSPQFYATLRK